MTRICIPVCVSDVRDLGEAIRSAATLADVVELRLDYLPEWQLNQAVDDIAAILSSQPQPVIVTLRPAEQGGRRAISIQDRLYFRMQNPKLIRSTIEDVWDVEIDLALLLQQREKEGNELAALGYDHCRWDRTICSYHDFVGVPADLEAIYEKMAATKARLIKIAVQADDAVDCLRLFSLLERAEIEGRKIIAVAMGEAGVMTRILGPSRGSYLTYASLDDESGNAPGQLQAKELREIYRIDHIDRDTQVFGIIGNPVSQSLSPHIHNAAFGAHELNAVYLPLEVHDAAQFIRRMVHPRTRELDWKLKGLSVTAPHKSIVMQELDWIDPVCREIGACNTIVVRDDQLLGYNTDAAGFIAPLREALGEVRDVRCAVVGAGGAARACVWALKQEGADVTVLARDKSRTEFLAQTFDVRAGHLPTATFKGFDVVINATPLGTRGECEHESIASAEQLQGVRLAYDLVYNPLDTRFLRAARAAGCESVDGLQMLLAQAVEQFKLWLGLTPQLETMRQAAVIALK